MLSGGSWFAVHSPAHGLILLCIAITLLVQKSASVVVPSSNCYVIDNSSRIFDFTDLMGHHFEYEGKGSPDVVVRFCKDVESRSQQGYVDFGHFSVSSYFVSGTGHVNFVQGFHKGDLMNCEHTYDKMGRAAKVNIICGKCSNGLCKGELGCICSVTYDSTMCRVLVELAIRCGKPGLRIFEGFTVGFHRRSWEVVHNGLTQLGFDKSHNDFSFETEQTHISLYMTAVASLSSLVGKPDVKVNPDTGLVVELSGSGTNGEQARDIPYEVAISIPIEFILTKKCEYKQDKEGEAVRGWATFGMLSCMKAFQSTHLMYSLCYPLDFVVVASYIRQELNISMGLGMTILAAYLETVSERGRGGYPQAENSPFINQTSWDHVPVSTQPTQKTSARNYGSI